MIFTLLYVFLYCNADIILNKLHLSHFDPQPNHELISKNPEFYNSAINVSTFTICLYSAFIVNKFVLFYTKSYTNVCTSPNKYSLALALVYTKYTSNILLFDAISTYQYEYSRMCMWLFSTTLMLKMYCEANHMKLIDINAQYHIFPMIINIIIYPYKGAILYNIVTGITHIGYCVFMKTMYDKRDILFTKMYLIIWSVFIGINVIDSLGIMSKYNINLFYLYADIISKLTTNIIIHEYNEKTIHTNNNTDLQSIELLQKILPLGFDKQYFLNSNSNIIVKNFDMICILFTDIVNYTELAKKYDNKIIFKMLNQLYGAFDTIIKKYTHLQKIETIGDAYMVVGDIYRHQNNHKTVIKEMILLALEFVKEVKTIETPDKTPLCIRVGINMGNVSIGILGNEVPRLCVVGNAVNVSSRLQSTANIDTIQMSGHIYEQLEDIKFDTKFDIIKHENVSLKNIGYVTTYNIYSNADDANAYPFPNSPPPPRYRSKSNKQYVFC